MSYERGKADALAWLDASIAAKAKDAGSPPIPNEGVPQGDDYDRGWNEIAALMNDPVASTFLHRSRTDPERWAHYVELCKSVGVDPYPSQVDPARVMREPAYAHGSALAAGLRLDFTRRVWGDV